MNSGDAIQIALTGVAQGPQGWNIAVSDLTANTNGNILLQNNNIVLPPFYAVAAPGNGIAWGADTVGAISFAYEIGSSLSLTASCGLDAGLPGDNACYSYWPGRWAQTGQNQLSLPSMGAAGNAVLPTQISFTSSVGGVLWVNNHCGQATQNVNTNCWYPYYQYQAATASFTFGTTGVPGTTNDYGNINQFPVGMVAGQFAANFQNTNNAQNALSLGGTPAPSPDRDTYIDYNNQNSNYGGSDPILVGSSSSNPVSATQIVLMHFTLPQLPAGAIFQSATLTLYNYAESGSGCCTIAVGALTKDWIENSVTWNSYGGAPALYGNQVVATSSVPCCDSPDSVDVTFFVNLWMAGTTPNYGFGILPNSPSETIQFQSRETPLPQAAMPQLAITYKFLASPPTVPTTLHVGETSTATVSMTNLGLTTWFPAAGTCAGCPVYRLGSQNPQDNTIWGLNRVNIAPTATVPPGNTYNFTFSITAPTTPGTYNFQWRMVAEANQFQLWFGDATINVQINVITPGPDFNMVASPTSLSLPRGASVTSNVDMTSLYGFQGTINLQASVSPQVANGPTVSFTGTSTVGSAAASTVIGTSGQASNPSYAFVQDGQSAVLTVPNTSSPASATYGFSVPSLPSNAAITKVRVVALHEDCGSPYENGGGGSITIPGVASTSGSFGFKLGSFGWGAVDITTMIGSWTANQVGQVQVTYSTSVSQNYQQAGYSDVDVIYLEVTYTTPTITLSKDATGTSILTVAASAATPANSYSVMMTGTSGSISHSVTIPVYVSVFTLSQGNTFSHNVPIGRSVSYSLTITPQGSYSGSVSLSLLTLASYTMIPTCVTTEWSQNPITLSATTTVSLTLTAPTGCSSSLGDYGFNVVASDSSIPYSTSLPAYLDISDYSVFAMPTTLMLPDGRPAQTLTATILGYNGYPGDFSTLNGGTTTTANMYLFISQPIGCVTTSTGQNIDTSQLATPGSSDRSIDNHMMATFTMSSSPTCYTTTYANGGTLYAQDNGGQWRYSSFTLTTSDFSMGAQYTTFGIADRTTVTDNINYYSNNNFPTSTLTQNMGFPSNYCCLSFGWSTNINLPSGGSAINPLSITASGKAVVDNAMFTLSGSDGYITRSTSLQISVNDYNVTPSSNPYVYIGGSSGVYLQVFPYFGIPLTNVTIVATPNGVPSCLTVGTPNPKYFNIGNVVPWSYPFVPISASTSCTQGNVQVSVTISGATNNKYNKAVTFTLQILPQPTGGGGGGGSVASGTLITMADGREVPVQQVQVGDFVSVYNVFTGQDATATVTQIRVVTVYSQLTIFTASGLPFRTDANPFFRLHVMVNGQIVFKPVTEIQPGDMLYNFNERAWVQVTRVEVMYGAPHTVYDLTVSPLTDFIANGYADCPKACPM